MRVRVLGNIRHGLLKAPQISEKLALKCSTSKKGIAECQEQGDCQQRVLFSSTYAAEKATRRLIHLSFCHRSKMKMVLLHNCIICVLSSHRFCVLCSWSLVMEGFSFSIVIAVFGYLSCCHILLLPLRD